MKYTYKILTAFFALSILSSSYATTFESLMTDLTRRSAYFQEGMQTEPFNYELFSQRLEQLYSDIARHKLGLFLAPNEPNPARFNPMYEQAPRGALVSVGTERGFAAAALFKAPQLVLVDVDPTAYLFNWINTHLLKAAHNREDYLRLRDPAGSACWDEVFNFFSSFPDEKKKIVGSFQKFWVDALNRSVLFKSLAEGKIFIDANYLFDDFLFDHVKQLATTDQIYTVNCAVEDPAFIFFLEAQKITVAVFDFSNTVNLEELCKNLPYQEESYLTAVNFIGLVYNLTVRKLLVDGSLILSTYPWGGLPTSDQFWVYCSLPFSAMVESSTAAPNAEDYLSKKWRANDEKLWISYLQDKDDLGALVARGHLYPIRMFLNKYPEKIRAGNAYGMPPIHIAARRQMKLLPFLLAQGATLEDTNLEGNTVLADFLSSIAYFAMPEQVATITALIEMGAQVDVDIRARGKKQNLIDFVREEGSKPFAGHEWQNILNILIDAQGTRGAN